MNEITNATRSEWAYRTLLAYQSYRGTQQDASSDTERVTDLLTDLHHLCSEYGVDMDACMNQAREHYHNEAQVAERPWSVVGYYDDEMQPFIEWVTASDEEGAIRAAVEANFDRNGDHEAKDRQEAIEYHAANMMVVEVIPGHLQGGEVEYVGSAAGFMSASTEAE